MNHLFRKSASIASLASKHTRAALISVESFRSSPASISTEDVKDSVFNGEIRSFSCSEFLVKNGFGLGVRGFHFSAPPLEFRASIASRAEFVDVDDFYDEERPSGKKVGGESDEGLEISNLGISPAIVTALVHITQGDYDGKAVIISWVTPEETGPSKVQYGTSENQYEFSAKGTVNNYTFYHYKSGYIHHCLVDGLKHNTNYYKIGTSDSSQEFWFQTPPEVNPDASYTFGIIGDLGQTYNSLSTLEHYMQSGAQTVLFVGDLSYADRYQYNDVGIRWDSWAGFVERSTAYQRWIWSVGNHEIEYMPEMMTSLEVVPFKSYLHRHATPYMASRSSNPLWYAIRRASAHFSRPSSP